MLAHSIGFPAVREPITEPKPFIDYPERAREPPKISKQLPAGIEIRSISTSNTPPDNLPSQMPFNLSANPPSTLPGAKALREKALPETIGSERQAFWKKRIEEARLRRTELAQKCIERLATD